MSRLDNLLLTNLSRRESQRYGLQMSQLDDQPSHWLVQTAISSLARLTHRGAIAADGKTGDGCGLLLKRPTGFLQIGRAHV